MAAALDASALKTSTGFRVSNAQELKSALAASTGGEEIVLASGNYGALSLYDARETFARFADTVTIRSEDPDAKAVFTSLGLNGVENLKFQDVTFDYTFKTGDLQRAREIVRLVRHGLAAQESYQRGVREERLRIASDLHDDLGAKLLTIAQAAGPAGDRVAVLARQAAHQLHELRRASRQPTNLLGHR